MLRVSAYICTVLYYLLGDFISNVSSQVTCSTKLSCQQQLGYDSHCNFDGNSSQGTCVCDDYYYSSPSNSTCIQCPGIGEACQKAQCCNEDCLLCYNGVCMYIYSDFCLGISDSERQRFQRVAQCILAVALVLTTSILLILFWKACAKRSVLRRRIRHMSIDSYVSLNSIQRLVLLQLQDRPPPYSREYNHPKKLMNEIMDPPPSYIEAVGDSIQQEGEVNPIFIVGDQSSTISSIQDTVTSDTLNSLPSDTYSSPPQPSILMSVTTSNELSVTQTLSTLDNPLPSLNDVMECCSQDSSDKCQDRSLVLTQNTELYM